MDRSEVIRLAREVFDVETDSRGRETFSGDSYGIERFAALVAAQEREVCAQLCDQMEKDAEGTDCCKWPTPADCAYAIRARSKG